MIPLLREGYYITQNKIQYGLKPPSIDTILERKTTLKTGNVNRGQLQEKKIEDEVHGLK